MLKAQYILLFFSFNVKTIGLELCWHHLETELEEDLMLNY